MLEILTHYRMTTHIEQTCWCLQSLQDKWCFHSSSGWSQRFSAPPALGRRHSWKPCGLLEREKTQSVETNRQINSCTLNHVRNRLYIKRVTQAVFVLYLQAVMQLWLEQQLHPWRAQPACSRCLPVGGTRPYQCLWSPHTPRPGGTWHCRGEKTITWRHYLKGCKAVTAIILLKSKTKTRSSGECLSVKLVLHSNIHFYG